MGNNLAPKQAPNTEVQDDALPPNQIEPKETPVTPAEVPVHTTPKRLPLREPSSITNPPRSAIRRRESIPNSRIRARNSKNLKNLKQRSSGFYNFLEDYRRKTVIPKNAGKDAEKRVKREAGKRWKQLTEQEKDKFRKIGYDGGHKRVNINQPKEVTEKNIRKVVANFVQNEFALKKLKRDILRRMQQHPPKRKSREIPPVPLEQSELKS